MAAVALAVQSHVFSEEGNRQESPLQPVLIALASVVAVVFLTNLYTWVRMMLALCRSHHRRIHSYLAHVDATNTGGYMEALKGEIELISAMVRPCLSSVSSYILSRVFLAISGQLLVPPSAWREKEYA